MTFVAINIAASIVTVFDRSGSGLISTDDIRDVLVGLGEAVSDRELADMMREADSDRDRFINYKGTDRVYLRELHRHKNKRYATEHNQFIFDDILRTMYIVQGPYPFFRYKFLISTALTLIIICFVCFCFRVYRSHVVMTS